MPDWSSSPVSAWRRRAQAAAVTMLVARRPSSWQASTKLARRKTRNVSSMTSVSRKLCVTAAKTACIVSRVAVRRPADPIGGEIEARPPRLTAKGPLDRTVHRGDVHMLEGALGMAPRPFGPRRAARAFRSRIDDRLAVQAWTGRPPSGRLALLFGHRASAPRSGHSTPVLAQNAGFPLHCFASRPAKSSW